MKESFTSEIELPDEDFNVFHELIHYIYTDSYSKPIEDVHFKQELLALASQYQVRGLIHQLEIEISAALTLDNCLQILVFADAIFANELKKNCLQFVAMNYDALSSEETLHALPSDLNAQIEQFKSSIFRKGFFKLHSGNNGDKRGFKLCIIS